MAQFKNLSLYEPGLIEEVRYCGCCWSCNALKSRCGFSVFRHDPCNPKPHFGLHQVIRLSIDQQHLLFLKLQFSHNTLQTLQSQFQTTIMSTTLFRTSSAAKSALRAGASKRAVSVATTSFIRGKATLPDLPCISSLSPCHPIQYRSNAN